MRDCGDAGRRPSESAIRRAFGRLDAEGHGRPFHTYSMRQAIEEGFTLDVLASYTTYGTYYELANAQPRNDPEMNAARARAALARFVSLYPCQLFLYGRLLLTELQTGGHDPMPQLSQSVQLTHPADRGHLGCRDRAGGQRRAWRCVARRWEGLSAWIHR